MLTKKGYFTTRWNNQKVARYLCKACGKNFSTHTGTVTFGQHKPYLNEQIFKWYSSSTTQRRMARVLGTTRRTIVRKFRFMAALSRVEKEKWLALTDFRTSHVQFDEMESFEHTRLKPLSIALAVCAKTGRVLDAQVASMPSKGKLAAVARAKYGPRPDTRGAAREKVLQTVSRVALPELLVVTDSHRAYPALVEKYLPHAHLRQVKSRVGKKRFTPGKRANRDDALFTLNHTSAKIRHDLSRMARRVWVTTKKAERLQAHLDLYISFHNRFLIAA